MRLVMLNSGPVSLFRILSRRLETEAWGGGVKKRPSIRHFGPIEVRNEEMTEEDYDQSTWNGLTGI